MHTTNYRGIRVCTMCFYFYNSKIFVILNLPMMELTICTLKNIPGIARARNIFVDNDAIVSMEWLSNTTPNLLNMYNCTQGQNNHQHYVMVLATNAQIPPKEDNCL